MVAPNTPWGYRRGYYYPSFRVIAIYAVVISVLWAFDRYAGRVVAGLFGAAIVLGMVLVAYVERKKYWGAPEGTPDHPYISQYWVGLVGALYVLITWLAYAFWR